jgi:Arc/MetJ-type ribon-helix-helix transcriptional regulator
MTLRFVGGTKRFPKQNTMPVTPIPPTILIELSEEYLALLNMASAAGLGSHQEIMRDAIAMLQAEDLPQAARVGESRTAARKKKASAEHAHLAAWDRWMPKGREQLALDGALADFVTRKVAAGGYPDAAGVVLVALLRYAKVKDFLPNEDDGES